MTALRTPEERRAHRIAALGKHAVARPLADRLWEKVNKNAPNGCWEWLGHVTSDGYGSIWVTGEDVRAKRVHRVAYELLVGPIPKGLTIDHLCRNRRCCNPTHMEPVTVEENTRRGKARQTHCIHGHEFTPENTHISPHGTRVCRTCKREEDKRRRNRLREGKSPDELGKGSYRRRMTHCTHGHEFTSENTRVRLDHLGRPGRVCIACERERSVRRRLKQRQGAELVN